MQSVKPHISAGPEPEAGGGSHAGATPRSARPNGPARRARLLAPTFYAALTLLMVSVVLTGRVRAQNSVAPPGNAPGSPAGSYALSSVETLNLYSGRVNTVIPLFKVGGRGDAGYTIKLPLDDATWATHKETNNGFDSVFAFSEPMAPAGRAIFPQPFEFGVVAMRYTGSEPACPEPNPDGPPTCFRYAAAVMVFTEADGTEHPLFDELTGGWASQLQHPYTDYNWQPGIERGLVFTAKDGTGLTFIADPPAFGAGQYFAKTGINEYGPFPGFMEEAVSGLLKMKDGTVIRFENSRARWIRDRNGNQTTFHYEPAGGEHIRLDKVTDSNNRVTDIIYGVGFEQIVYKGAGGLSRTITINRATLQSRLLPNRGFTTGPIGWLFPADPAHGSGNGFANRGETYNPHVFSAVTLPDGRAYSFYYNSYGELARLESPAGGAVEYDYGSGLEPDPANGIFVTGQLGKLTSNSQQLPIGIYRRLHERREYANGGATLTLKTTYTRYRPPPTSDANVFEEQTDPSTGQPIARRNHYFFGDPSAGLMTITGGAVGVGNLIEGREYRTETLALDSDAVLSRTDFEWAEGCSVPRSACGTEGVPLPWSAFMKSTTTRILETAPDQYRVMQQEFAYDLNDNLTDTYEYHYGLNQRGALARHTHTDYANPSNLINGLDYSTSAINLRSLPVRQQVFDAAGVLRALTTYEYDNYAAGPHHAALLDRAGISGLCTTYNSAGQCSSSNSTAYKTRGNVTAVTAHLLSGAGAAIGSVTSYSQFDVAGNVVKTIDARGNQTTLHYDDAYGSPDAEARANSAPQELGALQSFALPTSTINSAGHQTHAQYDYYLGVPVNTEDANEVISSTSYLDMLDRPTQVVRAVGTPQASQKTIDYNDDARMFTTTSDLNNYNDNLLKSETLYDGMGRATESRSYEDASAFVKTQWVYDPLGRVKTVTNPFRTTQDPTYGLTTTTYDALGRVEAVTKPDGTELRPDYKGTRVLMADQAGKKRLSDTNALGQLTDVWEIKPADADTVTVSFGGQTLTGYLSHYEYDTLGNLKQVTQGGQTRSFVYDSLSRLTAATNPEAGTTEYQYDANGNLVLKLDPRTRPGSLTLPTCPIPYTGNRVATCNQYDSLNRVKSRTYNDGTPEVNFTYDTLTNNGKGRLTSVSSSVSTYSFTGYDAAGNVTGSSQTVGTNTYTMSDYRYNLAGSLTSERYPSGKVVVTEYDAAGRLAGVKNEATGAFYAGAASADATNRVQYTPHGAAGAVKLGNGLWEHTNFNPRLQAVQIGLGTADSDSSRLRLDLHYGTNDNNGNVRGQDIVIAGSLSLSQTYTYDPLNRLDTAREAKADGTQAQTWKQRFTYDRFGNRAFDTGETTDNVEGPQLSFGPANNRITTTGFDHDAAGNLTAAPGSAHQYDAENRMVTVNGGAAALGGATYYYDGGGRRVKKVLPGETTVFVYNAVGQLVAEYSDQSTGGGLSYLTHDHLGSTRVVTDVNGAPKSRHDYLPFGDEIITTAVMDSGRESMPSYNLGAVRQKFTGYEHDSESGLDFAQARYYASGRGRFTSTDPLMASATASSPQTWNRYSYALNNPLRLTDPTGMEATTGHDGEPVQQPTPPPPAPRIPPIDSSLDGSPVFVQQEANAPTPTSATITPGAPTFAPLCANGDHCITIKSDYQMTFYDQYGQVMTPDSGILIFERVRRISPTAADGADPSSRMLQTGVPVQPDSNGVFHDDFGPFLPLARPVPLRTQFGILEGMMSIPTPAQTFEQVLTIAIVGRGIVGTAVSQRSYTNLDSGGNLVPYRDPQMGGLTNNFSFSTTPMSVYPRRR